jgi:hypothetical protein
VHEFNPPGRNTSPACSIPASSAPGLRSLRWFPAFAVLTLPNLFSQTVNRTHGGEAATAMAWQRYIEQSHGVLSSLNRAGVDELSAPPAGVTDLAFA